MKRENLILSLLFATSLHAQNVWTEGTEWETNYDDGTCLTYELRGHTVVDGTSYMNLVVAERDSLIGYVRAQGDTLIYARGLVGEDDSVAVLPECLLYDFCRPFEYGETVRFGVLQGGEPCVVSTVLQRETTKIVYYDDVLREGDRLLAWNNIVFGLGFLGNPMEIFYGDPFALDMASGRPTVRPNVTNVSHIVFRPAGGKPKVLRTLRHTEHTPVSEVGDFGFALYAEMARQAGDANLVMSPYSAQVTLSMLMNGAGGETLRQIRSTLGVDAFTADEVNSYCLQMAEALVALSGEDAVFEMQNAVWTQTGCRFEENFLQDLHNYFEAQLSHTDFASLAGVDTINAWAEAKTHGLIKKILAEPDNLLRLLLCNMTYFRGLWPDYFGLKSTYRSSFANLDGSVTEVDLMSSVTDDYNYAKLDNYEVAELNYGDKAHRGDSARFALLLFLPRRAEDYATPITPQVYAEALESMKPKKNLRISLPRFRLETHNNLIPPLRALGMTDAFGDKAEFSAIARPDMLYVKYADQFISFNVNEVGTEAAAVAVMGGGSLGTPTYFPATHPFQFVLYDKVHRIPLFVGRINSMADIADMTPPAMPPVVDHSIDGLYYEFDDESMEAFVTAAKSNDSGLVVVPPAVEYKGRTYAVTQIRSLRESWIASVVLPPTVRTIAANAFSDCAALRSVVLPEGVETIGRYAFCRCGLDSVFLPRSLREIDVTAFSGCMKLQKVECADIARYCGIKYSGNDEFFGPLLYAKNLYANGSLLRHLVVPDSVRTIEPYAFAYCDSLQTASLPGAETVGDNVFLSCPNLKSVSFGSSLRSLGYCVFRECHALTEIPLPENLQTIGTSAFEGCSSLPSLCIPPKVTSIPWQMCRNCRALTHVTIPRGVETIGNLAFEYCPLEEVRFPASLKSIGSRAFANGMISMKVCCAATTVPDASHDMFFTTTKKGSTLYVPMESIEAYRTSWAWKDFGNIVEWIPDGVNAVQSTQPIAPTVVFDLSGRRVHMPTRGIYIYKGKKLLGK